MALYLLLSFAIVSVALSRVNAVTPEEHKIWSDDVKRFVEECKQDYGVSYEKWVEAKKAKNFQDINKCAIACLFKKIGYINDKGLLDVVHVKDMGSKYFSNDQEKKVITELWDDCASVNDEKYSDGEMGCELSAKLMTCLLQHSGEIIR